MAATNITHRKGIRKYTIKSTPKAPKTLNHAARV